MHLLALTGWNVEENYFIYYIVMGGNVVTEQHLKLLHRGIIFTAVTYNLMTPNNGDKNIKCVKSSRNKLSVDRINMYLC